MDSIVNPKGGNNEWTRNRGTFLGFQHFGGRGVCYSSGMGIKKSDKQINYSHGCAKTKQHVG
jgi:hypothetical protein